MSLAILGTTVMMWSARESVSASSWSVWRSCSVLGELTATGSTSLFCFDKISSPFCVYRTKSRSRSWYLIKCTE